MAKLLYGLAALAFILCVVVLVEMYGIVDQPLLMNFLEKNFASDGKISNAQGQYIKILIISSKVMIFCLFSIFFFIKRRGHLAEFGLCSTLSVFLIILYILFPPIVIPDFPTHIPLSYTELPRSFNSFLYQEDGLMETLAVLLLFFATIRLFRSGSIAIKKRLDFKVIWALFIIGSFCFVIMMEEISWGQRIFGWQTPESYKELNSQGETNLHNTIFLKDVNLRSAITLLVSIVIYISIILRNKPAFMAIQGLLPLEKYLYQSNIFFFLFLFDIHDDLIEGLIYLFLFFHSRDVFRYFLQFRAEEKSNTEPICRS